LNGCITKNIDVKLLSADNETRHVDGAAEAQRQKRLAAERKKREDAFAAERKKRQDGLAAEQRKKQADAGAKAAEDRRKLRASCAAVYQKTIDRKITDLTVREEQQVRACQALSLYPPPEL